MPGPLRIGELSARTGRSVHTIRWYETQRLMPGVRRDTAGRRVYHEQHVGWLDLLDRLRRTGMTIRQMQQYTALVKQGGKTLAARRDLLAEHRKTVQAMIEDLSDSLQLIDSKIDFYGQWLVTGSQPALPRLPAPRPKRR